MDINQFTFRLNSCDKNVTKHEELEAAQMLEYKTSPSTETDFKVTYASWSTEQVLMQTDEVKKKNLYLENKMGHILIVGFDKVGKKTLLDSLKRDPLAQTISSTLHETSEELILGQVKFAAFDLGRDHTQAGGGWKDYFPAIDAVILLVDATDRRRFVTVKSELDSLLTDEQVGNAPIMILGTKNDLQESVSENKLRRVLGIFSTTTEESAVDRTIPNGRPINVFMCTVKHRTSFGAAFRWLSPHLKDKII